MNQICNHILMIEPAAFQFNSETATNNFYQNNKLSESRSQQLALEEFSAFVEKLKNKGISITVIKDTETPIKPDAIFPNNWVSFHENGVVILFPMWAENRRQERRLDLINRLEKKHHFKIKKQLDFSFYEKENKFLEGTGSMVLDRKNKMCYAAISVRTHEELVQKLCDEMNYSAILFSANQTIKGRRVPIYHTNVMMTIADKYAVICLETIDDTNEKEKVVKALKKTNKEIIEITASQKNCFAGNSLQVMGNDCVYLIMSSNAFHSLSSQQVAKIESFNPILHSDLTTIENIGGGSARCMMAEVFLPKSKH
ncbi:MAG: arginine deiminase-related protein [Flavobacteriales bacterium]|nr:arginine deiminase-related protein [Flavobacteriales bacterium]